MDEQIEIMIEEMLGRDRVLSHLCWISLSTNDTSCTLPGRPLIKRLVLRFVQLSPQPGHPPQNVQDFDKEVRCRLRYHEQCFHISR